MEERQSRLSNMDWRRFRPYLCVRLIPQNSMFSNFCHVLKSLHLKILICYLQSNGYVYVIVIFLFNVLIDIFIWECSIAEMYILIFLYSFH